MPNRFNRIASGSSTEDIIRQLNDNFGMIDNESVVKTFSGPNGTNSIVEGRLPTDLGYGTVLYDEDGRAVIYMAVTAAGQPVLKVAKAGKDATTGADSDLVFNSSQNVFKIISTATVSVTVPNGAANSWVSNIASLAVHNLGFSPMVFGSIEAGGDLEPSPKITYSASGGYGVISFSARIKANATDVYLQLNYHTDGAGAPLYSNLNVRYYLVQETAS